PHQGGGGPRARHAARPLPAHRHRARVDQRGGVSCPRPGGAHRELRGWRPQLARGKAMNPSFDFETPDHFTTGAVGPSGQRVFYLQARQARQLVTLKVEKEQVRALAEYLAGLLTRLKARDVETPDDLALLEPVEAAWSVGSIGVGYDEGRDRIVIEAGALLEGESEGEAASARFRITPAQAKSLIERGRGALRAR